MNAIRKSKFERADMLCTVKESYKRIAADLVRNNWMITDKKPVYRITLAKLRGMKKSARIKDPLKVLNTYFILVCERPLQAKG